MKGVACIKHGEGGGEYPQIRDTEVYEIIVLLFCMSSSAYSYGIKGKDDE